MAAAPPPREPSAAPLSLSSPQDSDEKNPLWRLFCLLAAHIFSVALVPVSFAPLVVYSVREGMGFQWTG